MSNVENHTLIPQYTTHNPKTPIAAFLKVRLLTFAQPRLSTASHQNVNGFIFPRSACNAAEPSAETRKPKEISVASEPVAYLRSEPMIPSIMTIALVSEYATKIFWYVVSPPRTNDIIT